MIDIICCPICRGNLQDSYEVLTCAGGHSFPIVDGIPVLLAYADSVTNEIKSFYESNWTDRKAKRLHEDLSELGQRYIIENERKASIPLSSGEYFLDAGCGAQPRIELGAGHRFHICFDLSMAGLIECRRKLGTRGIYILGSILQSPIKNAVVDNAIASHCIYHIEASQQVAAIKSVTKALRPGGAMTMLYCNPKSIEKRLVALIPHRKQGEIYFHPLPTEQVLPAFAGCKSVTVSGLRLFSQTISRPIFKLFGNLGYLALTWLERNFNMAPHSTYLVIKAIKQEKQMSANRLWGSLLSERFTPECG
jgi:uncharacterized protein YbaR (Trm112 family)